MTTRPNAERADSRVAEGRSRRQSSNRKVVKHEQPAYSEPDQVESITNQARKPEANLFLRIGWRENVVPRTGFEPVIFTLKG